MNHEKKYVKEVKMHKCLICAYKSKDFAHSQEHFAYRTHVRPWHLETLYKSVKTIALWNFNFSLRSYVMLNPENIWDNCGQIQIYN